MRHTIRSKLILFTVLPVLVIYSVLFWLGLSYTREHLGADAQRWSIEHARHQASHLALVLSQVPALAGTLGDLVAADPLQPQTLLYAHLIDGLRRTPIARSAGVVLEQPPRGALMRRGAPRGEAIEPGANAAPVSPGWQSDGDLLRFVRPVRQSGAKIGNVWVEISATDLYAEIERRRDPGVTLLIGDRDGALLKPLATDPTADALWPAVPADLGFDEVRTVQVAPLASDYWLISTAVPGLPWRLVAATRAEAALQPVHRNLSLIAMALLGSLAAIVLIIGGVARQITLPLQTLDASVQKIATGDFDVAPEVASNDELGRLARAIQRLARHIADREAQLRNAQQILEQRVTERTFALQQSNSRLIRQIDETRVIEQALRLANEQAQQASRAKSEFLSNMSHELRTPLHGVLGYAQILRRDTTTSDEQRDSLDAIERCGQHLLTLINDILDLSKIEAGRMRIDLQPTGLHRLLEDVRLIVAQRAAGKGLKLEVILDEALPDDIVTDPVKLKQILLNLLGNAVKFTQHGSVTLQAGLAGRDTLNFTVTDTGEGISPDRVDSIFDAFNQARDGQAVDGTGLGLAINQRLIGLLGGEPLTVESRKGAGSRFHFSIPYRPVPESTQDRGTGRTALSRPPASADPHHGDCAVMVIDAMEENRKLLSKLLKYARCEVEAFAGRGTAMQRLGEKPFQIVLMDVQLPDAAAAEIVTRVRQSTGARSARLVAVSANVFLGAERVAKDAGFDAFLAKPFDERQLAALLERLIPRPADAGAAPAQGASAWPAVLARETAERIRAAIDHGDVGSLFQLAEELAGNPAAPAGDVESMALMARLFDFDGLRVLSEALLRAGRPSDRPA